MTDYAYTTWSRLEPRPRSDQMRDGLQAAVGDPLWLLSRQWQFREFKGEDAGSPVEASVTVERDRLTRVDHRGGGRGSGDVDAGPVDYTGGPLEATVEREHVQTGPREPTARQAAEAGLQFLRTLTDHGYTRADGSAYAATDFPEELRLDEPTEAMPAADHRYFSLMAGRTLDGRAVYDAIAAGQPPVPDGETSTTAHQAAVTAYAEWFDRLYDEPTTESGSAWRPERMEYATAVSTGADERERVFTADEYAGGRLEWYDFSPAGAGETLGATDEDEAADSPAVTETETITRLPTAVRFPGMPSTRFWEFEDTAVSLDVIAGDGGGLPRLVLLAYALEYGNDWFRIPLETPVGTLSSIAHLEITDDFGVTDAAIPASDDDWNAFTYELSDTDSRGLFLPPTLSSSHESDPVERVVLTRDEQANLAFGVERLVEGPTGAPLDRTEFQRPALAVTAVRPNDDPALEYVELENTGDDAISLHDHVLESDAQNDGQPIVTFDGLTLPAGGTARVFTGALDDAVATRGVDETVGAGRSTSVWTGAEVVILRGPSPDRRIVASRLLQRAPDALADYRLVGELPDYWFPLVSEGETGDRLARALLLDADTLGLAATEIPRPQGKLLGPTRTELPAGEENLRLYEEEVPQSGREVTRQYQLARWTDGRTYLWSGRNARPGREELSSGLSFDRIVERRR